jgi:hypothetical protein
MMKLSEYSSKKIVNIEAATKKQTQVTDRSSTFRSAQKLTISHKKNSKELWQLNINGDVEIVFGEDKLTELEDAIRKVRTNEGDFAIADSKDENILYFWWHLE